MPHQYSGGLESSEYQGATTQRIDQVSEFGSPFPYHADPPQAMYMENPRYDEAPNTNPFGDHFSLSRIFQCESPRGGNSEFCEQRTSGLGDLQVSLESYLRLQNMVVDLEKKLQILEGQSSAGSVTGSLEGRPILPPSAISVEHNPALTNHNPHQGNAIPSQNLSNNTNMLHDLSNRMIFPPNNEIVVPQFIRLTDFSPEWDYLTGGAKIIICYTPSLPTDHLDASRLRVCFGDQEVAAIPVQNGVIKCYAPPHTSSGFVRLKIKMEDRVITDFNNSGDNMFEYRKPVVKKAPGKKRRKVNNGGSSDGEHDETFYRSEFKVKVIERLDSLTNMLKGKKEDRNLDQLADILQEMRNDIELVDEQMILKALNTLMTYLQENDYLPGAITDLLNENDADGLGLIHYFAALIPDPAQSERQSKVRQSHHTFGDRDQSIL
eukprot:TRINITY_DN6969_c0_g1_i1.p1 TRINITY_DN6969_c0_g1~~TRINITY_DN6969_c0_g1_i1.p1  ORF type:complete len:435 (+),score=81.34 TRINITY_DN6969_c0_g1_i1:319-1623(+)